MKTLVERNKLIVQLAKLGWSKYSIAQLFAENGVIQKWDKVNVYLVLKRDFSKYDIPTREEIENIEKTYNVKVEV